MKGMLFFLFLLPTGLFAADDPTVVLDSEKYDQTMCVEEIASDCVNTICPTSEERDCTDKCQADAEEKCGPNAQ